MPYHTKTVGIKQTQCIWKNALRARGNKHMTDHYIGDVQELLQSVVRQNENEKEQNVIQLKNKGVQGI